MQGIAAHALEFDHGMCTMQVIMNTDCVGQGMRTMQVIINTDCVVCMCMHVYEHIGLIMNYI